jgi:hypothetical protein
MRLESQLSRMNCQTFSTGLSSGHFGGSRMMVIRQFFNPPADERLAYGPRRRFRGNKLSAAEPIEADGAV